MDDRPLKQDDFNKAFLSQGKGWIAFEGIVLIIIGALGIAFPHIMSVTIAQLLGILSVLVGVFGAGGALFAKGAPHRLSSIVSGLIAIAVGLLLLTYVQNGVLAITLVLGAYFLAEGIFCVITAFCIRGKVAGWVILLANGIITLVLAGLIFAAWPSDADWALGLLYGINMVFSGVSFLSVAIAMPSHS